MNKKRVQNTFENFRIQNWKNFVILITVLFVATSNLASAQQANPFKVPGSILGSLGLPESGESNDPKIDRELKAIKDQLGKVEVFLPVKLSPAQIQDRKNIIKIYNRRRTGVSFFIFSQILAEMVERGSGESNSLWNRWVHNITGGQSPEKAFEERRQCVAMTLDKWSELSESGEDSSTQQIINKILSPTGPLAKTPLCLRFIDQIIGQSAINTVHGQFLDRLMAAESVFKIASQKQNHLEALRLLISQSSDQFPMAALGISEFYLEDSDPTIKGLASQIVSNLETQYKVRKFMNWISPDALSQYVAGGFGVRAGFRFLIQTMGTSAMTALRIQGNFSHSSIALGDRRSSPK